MGALRPLCARRALVVASAQADVALQPRKRGAPPPLEQELALGKQLVLGLAGLVAVQARRRGREGRGGRLADGWTDWPTERGWQADGQTHMLRGL
eukprot:5912307-Pleurochrysis_carterae.AAC.2